MAGSTVDAPPRTPAVVAAFAAMDVLADRRDGLRFTDLVGELGLAKSTTHRLLNTMLELGAVAKDNSGDRFVLGPKVASYLQRPSYPYAALLAGFYALAEQIRDRRDETIQLAVLSGSAVTFIGYVETTAQVRLMTRIGRRLPAHASASGKAMLAFAPEASLRLVLDAGLSALTEATIVSEARLRAELARVREVGYAVEVEEASHNLSCFSAPVLDKGGLAVAAVTACVPARTVDAGHARDLIDEVRAAAEQIARYL
ncbi:MAG: IclR family transcriptional regulator [Nocardioidaceae bacterium]